jgi:hypothetical protein
MKNVLIVILTMALSAAAFLTRPNEDDFRDLLAKQAAAAEQPAPPAKGKAKHRSRPAREAQDPLAKAEMLDRIFWVEVRGKDGQTLYAGCFNHWWDKSGRMQRM